MNCLKVVCNFPTGNWTALNSLIFIDQKMFFKKHRKNSTVNKTKTDT